MKRTSVLLIAGILGLASAAALTAQTRSDIEVTRGDIQADRKAIVAANLPLSDIQATGFWPIYREYRAEMDQIGDRTVKAITSYADNYGNMDDKMSTDLMNEFLATRKDSIKVKDKYMPRFTKVIPAKSVLRFYQIENKLDTIVMMNLVGQIPLAK